MLHAFLPRAEAKSSLGGAARGRLSGPEKPIKKLGKILESSKMLAERELYEQSQGIGLF